jgi:hypothetical protein
MEFDQSAKETYDKNLRKKSYEINVRKKTYAKLRKLDRSGPINVNFVDHVLNLGVSRILTQRSHHCWQFLKNKIILSLGLFQLKNLQFLYVFGFCMLAILIFHSPRLITVVKQSKS